MQQPICRGCGKLVAGERAVTLPHAGTYHASCFACGLCKGALLPSSDPESTRNRASQTVRMHRGTPVCERCWTDRCVERCAKCRQPFAPKERIALFAGTKLHTECFKCAGPCSSILDGKYVCEGDVPYCPACHGRLFGPKCTQCAQPIEAGAKFVVHKGRKLHPGCFCCAECGVSLGTGGGGHYEREGLVYCAEHFRMKFGPPCTLCSRRLLNWMTAPTGEVYCREHEGRVPQCHACGRLVGGAGGGGGSDAHGGGAGSGGVVDGGRGVDLPDGRTACSRCDATAVHTLSEARGLAERVRTFLMAEGLGGLPELDELQLAVLERSDILSRRAAGAREGSFHLEHRCPIGITCAAETATVQGGAGGRVLSRSRKIECVAILKGLPAALFASTVAHELGHVYLHLHGTADPAQTAATLPPALAEGVCELCAYLWLTKGDHDAVDKHKGAAPGGSDSEDGRVSERKERGFRVEAMLRNSDRIYGQGLRDALAAYYAVGSSLTRLLEEVKHHRRLPTAGSRLPIAGAGGRLPIAGAGGRLPTAGGRLPTAGGRLPTAGTGTGGTTAAAGTGTGTSTGAGPGGRLPIAGSSACTPSSARVSVAPDGTLLGSLQHGRRAGGGGAAAAAMLLSGNAPNATRPIGTVGTVGRTPPPHAAAAMAAVAAAATQAVPPPQPPLRPSPNTVHVETAPASPRTQAHARRAAAAATASMASMSTGPSVAGFGKGLSGSPAHTGRDRL